METVWIAYLFIIGLISLPFDMIGMLFTADEVLANYVGMTVCRAIAFAVIILVTFNLGLGGVFRSRGKWRRVILICIPAFIIAVNNAPIIALIRGDAGLNAPAWTVFWFALQCLFVGAFEEISFRGVIFPLMLQKFGTERKGRLIAVIFSSALFGALHLINLFSGAGVGATFLQVGYSFLIGAMLAVTMFCGGSVLICAALHGLYNFFGLLIPELGYGALWDLPTVIITAILGIAVFITEVFLLLRADSEPMRQIAALKETEAEKKEKSDQK